MTYLGSVIFLVGFLFLETGCSQLELARAFQGEFNSERNNKVIGEKKLSLDITPNSQIPKN